MADTNTLCIFQKGFNYSQDGPGNRLVYHLSGCNLFCPWCSNPQGLKKADHHTTLSIDEIVTEAISCKMIFIDGGGVTFTGGEVSCQKDAVLKTITELKKNNISTCIETNASTTDCNRLYDEVDYMIADFKSPNRQKLKDIVGAEIDIIKENLLSRAKSNKHLLIRIPLINYFNCSEKDFDGFAEYFTELQKESKSENLFFEILTYHEFGKDKYNELNMEYTVTDGYVTPETARKLAEKIKKANLKLINT